MIIKEALESDLSRIAECHISAFPKSLSSALGTRYVTKMLGWYLSLDRTFLFFLEEEDLVMGYCGGVIKEGNMAIMGSASSMAQYSFDEGIRAFLHRPWLMFHPELRAKYLFVGKNLWTRLKRFFRADQKKQNQTSGIIVPYVALIVIGVRADKQGKGYGSMLLQEFERKTIELGYKKMLLTVLTNNIKAIKSYEKNAWVIANSTKQSTTMEKQWN